MTDEKRDQIHESVLRMVLWDEQPEIIFQKLSANGLEGSEAQAIYEKALRERIASIRVESLKKTGVGAAWIGGAYALFAIFWNGLGGITGKLLILAVLAGGIGTWKFAEGLVGMCMARSKRGSIADMD